MVLVLCGLPGCGKTTLARQLVGGEGPSPGDTATVVRHVSFDAVYEAGEEAQRDGSGATAGERAVPFTTERWHEARSEALLGVERLLQEALAGPQGVCSHRVRLG